ncbi:MAG: hypothetical protein M5U28_19665 [Sandaracinaceae bacterium]|nr:hypothetical protein [Sandaracinaceae bacterium]
MVVDGATLTLGPDGTGSYAPVAADGTLITGGDPIVIRAAGADVPAFTRNHTGPRAIELTEPPLSTLSPLGRDAPLTLRWTGSSDGRVVAAIVQGGLQVRCQFDPSAATGAIPIEALSELSPGSAVFAVIADVREVGVVSGWRVRTAVRRNAQQGGADAVASITIE